MITVKSLLNVTTPILSCLLVNVLAPCASTLADTPRLDPAAAGELAQRQLHLDDLAKRVDLSSPVLSPLGTRVAVVVSRANLLTNRFDRVITLVSTELPGSQPHEMRISSTLRPNADSPRWAADGRRLAWLDTGKDDRLQIYVARIDSPHPVPLQLTHAKKGVDGFEWSPDGRSIAFIAPDALEKAPGRERHNRSFEVIDNDYLTAEAPVASQLWIVSASGGAPTQLTHGPDSIVSLDWSLSSDRIVFASQPRPHNGEFMNSSSKDTSLKTIHLTTGTQNSIVDAGARITSRPQSAPAGGVIAYIRFRGPEPYTRPQEVAVVPEAGGEPHVITGSVDRDIVSFALLPDGKSILAAGPDGTQSGLWQHQLDGTSRRLNIGSVSVESALTVGRGAAVAFVGSEPEAPQELYLMNSLNEKPRKLTAFNQFLVHIKFGASRTIHWHIDEFDETGVLLLPPRFDSSRPPPLVLSIHGGPELTSSEGFDMQNQLLAAQGWAVFSPNYRGSDSQGDAFQRAIVKDLGDGPARDVMAGVAEVVKEGLADGDQIAVTGSSYGGFMTAWLIGHYHNWRSAVMDSAITTMFDWYTLSCCNVWADPTIDGSPFVGHNLDAYWRFSPIASAHSVTTPTLITANAYDHMVPVTNSYHFYHALRDNGIPVRFVVYPVEGHGTQIDPVHERDHMKRFISWIAEHFSVPTEASTRVN